MQELHYMNFHAYPVIAAVKTVEEFDKALHSDVRVISMVGGDFFQTTDLLLKARKEQKTVLVHMDLIEGIGKDKGGINFAKEKYGIAGIHSTRSHILKIAKAEGLITIHRLFITDSQSISSGFTMVKISNPDYVEVTPGIMPRVVQRIQRKQSKPVITCGLIQSAKDVFMILKAGASNVVCSEQSLWEKKNIII